MVHDIDDAFYYRQSQPCLQCSCGKRFAAYSWAEAGRAYDEHLTQIDALERAKERLAKETQ